MSSPISKKQIDPNQLLDRLNAHTRAYAGSRTQKLQELPKIATIVKQFQSKKYLQRDAKLELAVVKAELLLKKDSNEVYPYELISSVAKRVFNEGKQITKGNDDEVEQAIFSHPEEYLFLTNRQHFISKNILVLAKRWQNDCLIEAKDGELKFHTGETVREKMESAPAEGYHLDNFEIRTKASATGILTHNFKLDNHDSNFYACIVTDAPEESPSMDGHHAWLRLINDKGEVISIGKFPESFDLTEMFEQHDTVYQTADRHEFLGRPGNTIKEKRFQISSDKYDELKKDIERDLANTETSKWSQMGSNCADWAILKLEKNKIIKPMNKDRMKKSPWLFIMPSIVRKAVFHIGVKAPKPVGMVFDLIWLVASRVDTLGKFIIFATGGLSKNNSDSKLRNFQERLKNTVFADTRITHPYYLRHYIEEAEPFVESNQN